MSPNQVFVPRDAKEALELWDKGEPIAAFEVETERCTQAELYALAFEVIRGAENDLAAVRKLALQAVRTSPIAAKITPREIDTAHSIAHVAILKGWAAMVAQHLASGHIKSLTIQKNLSKGSANENVQRAPGS
jgi:hypothetical protein